MSEWLRRLRSAWRSRPVSRRESVNLRLTLESFENVKLVPFEDHGDRDTFYLSASDVDAILSNDVDQS